MDHYQLRDTSVSTTETEGVWKATGTVVSVLALQTDLGYLLTSLWDSAGMGEWG